MIEDGTDTDNTNTDKNGSRRSVLSILGIVLLAPPLLLFALAGIDVVGNIAFNPFRFVADASYRRQTQARWQQTGSMARETGALVPIVVLVALTLCVYYAIFALIVFHAIPQWMTRAWCFLAPHACT
jgi:hypothetical protein